MQSECHPDSLHVLVGHRELGTRARSGAVPGVAVARGWLTLGHQERSQASEETSSTSQHFLAAPKGSLLVGSHFLHK